VNATQGFVLGKPITVARSTGSIMMSIGLPQLQRRRGREKPQKTDQPFRACAIKRRGCAHMLVNAMKTIRGRMPMATSG